MYHEKPKLSKTKIIEIILLVILILWAIVLLINYKRYTESKVPILSIHLPTKEYSDGTIDEYVGLGYVYRRYQRTAISRDEFVPFWVPMEEVEDKGGLPTPLKAGTEYNVPENKSKKDSYLGIVYFYGVSSKELVGTYKCLNTNAKCSRAVSGTDKYDLAGNDPLNTTILYKMEMPYDLYGFIDDSYEQESSYGDSTYTRTIYLYKISDSDPEILARYADVKQSYADSDKELGMGDNHRYIVKDWDTGKWGLIHLEENGTIEEVLPFEYDSINYDQDTDYYILCKDGKWYIYDLYNEEVLTSEIDDPIYDVWRNDNLTYYYFTGRDRTVGDDSFTDFKVYRLDGKVMVSTDKVTAVLPRGTYIMYLDGTDNKLKFMDYGLEVRYSIQLNFSNMRYDEYSQPAFKIYKETEKMLLIRVYDSHNLTYNYEVYSINTVNWDYND